MICMANVECIARVLIFVKNNEGMGVSLGGGEKKKTGKRRERRGKGSKGWEEKNLGQKKKNP